MMIAQGGIDRIAKNAWDAYRHVQDAINALESVGLSVDGCSGKDGVPGLFGALTAAGNVLLAAYGVPDEQPWSDEAFEALANACPGTKAPETLPDSARRALAAIAEKAAEQETDGEEKRYDVTVAMTGGISVRARSRDAALAKVDAMDQDAAVRLAAWDGLAPTDAYENGDE